MTFCQLLASSCLYVAHSLALMIATTRLSHCSMLPPLVASHELNDFFLFGKEQKGFKVYSILSNYTCIHTMIIKWLNEGSVRILQSLG